MTKEEYNRHANSYTYGYPEPDATEESGHSGYESWNNGSRTVGTRKESASQERAK